MSKKTEKCKAKTKIGKHCRRNASEFSFCKQHHTMYYRETPPLHSYPPGKITQVPPPPEDLDEQAAGRFAQYCGYLIDQDLLQGIHLHGIYELCKLEMDLRQIDKDIEVNGRYNHYDSGLQPSGAASEFNKVMVRIEKYRQLYGFIPKTSKSPKDGTGKKPDSGKEIFGSKFSKMARVK